MDHQLFGAALNWCSEPSSGDVKRATIGVSVSSTLTRLSILLYLLQLLAYQLFQKIFGPMSFQFRSILPVPLKSPSDLLSQKFTPLDSRTSHWHRTLLRDNLAGPPSLLPLLPGQTRRRRRLQVPQSRSSTELPVLQQGEATDATACLRAICQPSVGAVDCCSSCRNQHPARHATGPASIDGDVADTL